MKLLILACSARKRQLSGFMKAWDLYDGAGYRVCKKLQREGKFPTGILVRILSAEYGLIWPQADIRPYDRVMDLDRAKSMGRDVRSQLRSLVVHGKVDQVFVFAGARYREALLPYEDWWGNAEMITARGGIGSQLCQLRAWLLGELE